MSAPMRWWLVAAEDGWVAQLLWAYGARHLSAREDELLRSVRSRPCAALSEREMR